MKNVGNSPFVSTPSSTLCCLLRAVPLVIVSSSAAVLVGAAIWWPRILFALSLCNVLLLLFCCIRSFIFSCAGVLQVRRLLGEDVDFRKKYAKERQVCRYFCFLSITDFHFLKRVFMSLIKVTLSNLRHVECTV